MRRNFAVGVVCIGLIGWGAAGCVDVRAASPVISLNQSITYQTFEGWGAPVLPTVLDYKRVLPAYDALLDQAVNDSRSPAAWGSRYWWGTEHPPGFAEQYINGTLPESTFITRYAYEIINDNSNPNVVDLKGFDFSILQTGSSTTSSFLSSVALRHAAIRCTPMCRI